MKDIASKRGILFVLIAIFAATVLVSSTSFVHAKESEGTAHIVRIGAVDGDDYVQIEIISDGVIEDVSLDNKKGRDNLDVFIPNVSFDAHEAWIKTTSERLGRLKIQTTPHGVHIVGQSKKLWTSSAIHKDGHQAYVRLYFDTALAGKHVTIPVVPVAAKSSPPTYSQPPSPKTEKIEALIQQLEAPGNLTIPSSMSVPEREGHYVGTPISLDLVDADIKNVIRLIAEISGTNIVVDPNIQGFVTMRVENVPWDQVLEMIMEANDLGTKRQGNVIRIATKQKLQSELEQEQALAEAQLSLIEKQAELEAKKKNWGPIETAFIPIYYIVGIGTPGGTTKTERETTAVTLTGATVTTKETEQSLITALLQPLLSERGEMVYDYGKRMLIVRDYRSRIEEIKQVIARMDVPPEQVKLEVRIVEAIHDFSKALGIRWGFAYENTGSTSFSPSFAVNFPIDTVTSTLGFGWSLIKGQSMFNIDMALNASKEVGEIKLVASPVVYTMTNQEAKITQGYEIPVLEMTEEGQLSIEYKDVLLDVSVIPSVTPDNRILMTIHTVKQDIGPERILAEAAGLRGVDILKKTLDTNVLINDGTIVVLGGVLREDNRKITRSTPGFENIPIFGRLFRSNELELKTEELLIFICPKIIELPPISTASATYNPK